MKIIFQFIAFLFVYSFYFPFKILPYKSCLSYGVLILKLLFPLAKKHRKIAYENISYAFPELSEKEKLVLVKKHFLHLGKLMAGTLYAPRINKKWMDEFLVYDEESLKLEQDSKKENVGVVLISGHLGTWEILVQFMGIRMKGAGIYKKIRNVFVNDWIKKMRGTNGIVLVSTEETAKSMKLLKENYFLGFGADQNAGKAGIFVDFLNRKASTYQGPALMAYLTNSKILFYSAICSEEGKILIRIKNLGFINKKEFASREEAVRVYTEKWAKVLEEEIKLFPEQYFWVHRRWRTKPGDFPGQV